MLALRKMFALKNVNISIALSTLMHFGIFSLLAWKASEAVTSIPPQQVIMVELSAMQASMPTIKTDIAPTTKPITNTKTKKPELVKKKQEKPEQDIQENQSEHSASGEAPSNDDQTQSAALTEPAFNAAYLKNPPPVYPQAARIQNIEGEVLLKVEVSEEGRAESISVAKSSGSSLLDYAAISAVKKWKFIPAKQGEDKVVASVVVPIIFRLKA